MGTSVVAVCAPYSASAGRSQLGRARQLSSTAKKKGSCSSVSARTTATNHAGARGRAHMSGSDNAAQYCDSAARAKAGCAAPTGDCSACVSIRMVAGMCRLKYT